MVRLKEDNVALLAYWDGAKEGIDELRNYLLSSKFYGEPTVHISDVLNRINDIFTLANDKENSAIDAYRAEKKNKND